MKKLILAGVVSLFMTGGAAAAGASMVPGTTYDWTGIYVGVHGGVGWQDISGLYDTADVVGPANLNALDDAGIVFGAQIGANFQRGNFVFGIEGDISVTSTEESFLGPEPPPRGPDPISLDNEYLGSIRGKLGFAFNSTVIYGTAGWGFGSFDLAITETLTATPGSMSIDTSSAVFGVGVGVAITDRAHATVEFLHYAFDETKALPAATFPDADAGDFIKIDSVSVVRFGVNIVLGNR